MVLLMGASGALQASQSQTSFARTYVDGVGLEADPEVPQAATFVTKGSRRNSQRLRSPLPHPNVLSAIEATALRYAGHAGPRAARLSATDWMTLYRANIEVESGYNPRALSHVGAIGLGQLMPATARQLGVDPHDVHQNLDGSARYLAMMLAEFGDARLALAAYNAGPEAVRRHAGIPHYRETRTHVQRVLAVVQRLKGASE
ncbi:lytic transglycosylase domain-containing protein [Oceanicola sp. 502str15]|uniref:lytic transglycosylase domain-containing protein n=1 Tax=Oceanicola sp. 502str15 TaxID=2696061 RepID=UPI00209462BE|nr:lytic transglycosylase domain-containing protein [Oceanicola sp. 502str15]MCO6385276.1 transglycosylase SLT domain-containing protein [Oceanicola sp. 502str15]